MKKSSGFPIATKAQFVKEWTAFRRINDPWSTRVLCVGLAAFTFFCVAIFYAEAHGIVVPIWVILASFGLCIGIILLHSYLYDRALDLFIKQRPRYYHLAEEARASMHGVVYPHTDD